MSGARRLRSRTERAAIAARFAADQGGVVHRRQLRSCGVGRDDVRAEVDGAVALLAAGLAGFTTDRLDVSLPHRNRHHRVPGITVHRRRVMPEVVGAGLPRVRPAQAALHAAQWAASDRQAALVLCLVVQQRLVRPADLDVGWEDVGLVVETDGGHHAAALAPLDDALRQNDVVLSGATVLRIPVIGLRLEPRRFMDQVAAAHARLAAAAA